MSNPKRRGRRPGTPRRPSGAKPSDGPGANRGAAATIGRSAPGLKERPGAGPFGGDVQHRQPPLALSVARGMRCVGGSPLILATSFLAALALWLALSAYGVNVAATPAAMAALEALPPVHSFLDLQFLASGGAESPLAPFVLGAFLLVFRSAMQSWLISLIFDGMREGTPGRPSPMEALRRALKSLPTMVVMEAGFLGLAVLALFLLPGLLGASLGQLGVLFALFGGMYLFLHAPVVAVSEGAGLRRAVSIGIRAARLPGNRYVVFVFAYLVFVTVLSVTTPASPVAAATPTFALWAYVLFVSFVHVSALGILVYRWLAVREGLTE